MDKRIKIISISLCSLLFSMIAAYAEDTAEFDKVQYMSSEQKTQWFTNMQKKIAISQRDTCPFGLFQDITVKLIKKSQPAPVKSDAFAKAIKAIKIHIVMGNAFIIGVQKFEVGEIFPLEYKKNKFTVKVISVNTDRIIFKNTKTGEQEVKMSKASSAIQRDNGTQSTEGITPANSKKQNAVKINE